MSGDDRVRASDRERDETIDRLREAAAEGRLNFDELADRIGAASQALTRGELAELTHDLPAPKSGVAPAAGSPPAPPSAPPPAPPSAPPSATAPPPAPGGRAAAVRSLGDITRTGAWIVPRESEYRSWMGHIQLDLRHASFEQRDVTIRVWALFGTVDILVPKGVAIDARVHTTLGQLKQDAGDPPAPGAPRVTIAGRAVFGTVRIRYRKLWEKLARFVT